MNVELDGEAKALYLRLRSGRVADTVELADAVVMDMDGEGHPLGIEFVHAEDFGPFLREHRELVAIPSRLSYERVDGGRTWEVVTGAIRREHDETDPTENLMLNARFISEVIADPSTLDAIAEGAVVVLAPSGDAASLLARSDITERLSSEGRSVVLRSLGAPAPMV